MPNDRLIKLLALKESLPNDPFVDYAMALEHIKINENDQAKTLFKSLENVHPEYLPFYYHYGLLLINTQALEMAELIVNKGMEIARSQQDMHTLSELQTLLDQIEDS